jgi:predicted PhzF superfamily epimerase YddE/YHI9
VVLGAEGLSTKEIQRFANWTNLSETVFVLPPTTPAADYRVRIFTTTIELPFAGHPTIGTCHAWPETGGRPASDEVVVRRSAERGPNPQGVRAARGAGRGARGAGRGARGAGRGARGAGRGARGAG